MASPTKDSSTIINQQGQGQGQDHGGNGDVGDNPMVGFGPSFSPDPTTQANETDQTPTSTEVEPSQTPPPPPSPTLPVITSSGGVCEITSHALDLPPAPLIPPAASNVVASSGKRGRPSSGDEESSSSSSSTPRKSSRGDYTCIICGREFSTDKSYYGHLRKHPERVWRGAYPPRAPVREVKKSGPTPLELANQTSARILSGRGPSSTSYSSSRGSLGIDLNNPPPPTSADDRAPLLPFDLNMPPPIENDDGEEEDPDN